MFAAPPGALALAVLQTWKIGVIPLKAVLRPRWPQKE